MMFSLKERSDKKLRWDEGMALTVGLIATQIACLICDKIRLSAENDNGYSRREFKTNKKNRTRNWNVNEKIN